MKSCSPRSSWPRKTVVNYDDGTAELEYELVTEAGASLSLEFEEAPSLATGDRIRAVGQLLSPVFVVREFEQLTSDSIGSVQQALTGNSVRTRSRLAPDQAHFFSV